MRCSPCVYPLSLANTKSVVSSSPADSTASMISLTPSSTDASDASCLRYFPVMIPVRPAPISGSSRSHCGLSVMSASEKLGSLGMGAVAKAPRCRGAGRGALPFQRRPRLSVPSST